MIVVEGLLDLAALWQAGFVNAVAVLGSHLNSIQLAELCGATGHTVTYLCFDADGNGSGQRAARVVSHRLERAGVEAVRVHLPSGQDPASLLCERGRGRESFGDCLEVRGDDLPSR